MAHHVEPMDVDSDFDNKENSLHHNNVLPFTEKGYEELDVSELNMKLRYSVTPTSSPMSKSYTAPCPDNRVLETGEESLNNTVSDNVLTRSLNSTMTKNDNIIKSLKSLPLQTISAEQFTDNNRNTSVLRPIESVVTPDNANITVTVSGPSEIDENVSLPSSSSSALQTPEATTPTNDIPLKDGGSPIMRGLKSVLNMFRSSQSPIPSADNEITGKTDILSPADSAVATQEQRETVLASTPIAAHRKKEMSPTKRSSPQKDKSIVFNDDLEKELQWKDETTIIFSQERIPIHKLMFQQPPESKNLTNEVSELSTKTQDLNSTVEYMDISYNDSIIIRDNTLTVIKSEGVFAGESDSEFVDCETTFTKNESNVLKDNEVTPVVDQIQDLDLTKEIESTNESGSRLKQIILDTTQDILDATLSVRPEDLLPEILNKAEIKSTDCNMTETVEQSKEFKDHIETSIPQLNQPLFDQTVNAINEDLNTTKTINCLSSSQPSDQTFDVSSSSQKDNLDVTKTIKNNLDVTQILDNNQSVGSINNTGEFQASNNEGSATSQLNKAILDQTVDVSNSLTLEPVEIEPNAITPSQSSDQSLEVNSSSQKGNLDVTRTAENILSVTQILETSSDENVNTAQINETISIDNKTDGQVMDNVAIKTVEDNLASNSIPVPLEEEIKEPLPILDDPVSSLVKEKILTELPVDIPLPDEDDLDKELTVPTDLTTTPVSLPLDLVDDIKLLPEINEDIQSEPSKVVEVQLSETLSNDDINVLSHQETAINTSIVQGKDNLNDQSISLPSNDVMEESCKTHEEIKPEICPVEINVKAESVDLLPEVLEVISEQTKIKNDIEDANKAIENVDQNPTQNQEVVSMDINESVTEFKPLPDIINQTIAMSNTETYEASSNVSVTLPSEHIESEQEHIEDKANEIINSEIVLEAENGTEPSVLSTNSSDIVEPIIETSKVIKESPISPDVAIGSEESPHEATNDFCVTDVTMTEDAIETNAVPITSNATDTEKIPIEVIVDNQITESAKAVEEEIVLSENNSPFVSVIADNLSEIKFEESTEIKTVENIVTKSEVVMTPPSSPPIRSKGYNFNFDDMDFDPFATKTNIRMSPPLDSPNKAAVEPKTQAKTIERPLPKKDINRRKSQPERKRPTAPKRKFNSTFDGSIKNKPVEKLETGQVGDIQLDPPTSIALNPNNVTIEEKKLQGSVDIPPESVSLPKEIIKTESEIQLEHKNEQPIEPTSEDDESNVNELKATSSSEVSTYFSAGTSSSESNISTKNVFNLPEIDDMNFNPFATKSKMRQSPQPSEMEDPFATNTKFADSPGKITPFEDKIETELMEKDASGDISNTTASSKATAKEIHTEDEDTIEGPFLEVEDLIPEDKLSEFDGENVDMMQFNELPTQSNEENIDSGEMFIDAEAFEFLLNQNKTNTVVDSGKESLFLKFDPLFAKRMSAITSDGVLASLNKLQKNQSTPTKAAQSPPNNTPSPIAGSSNLDTTQDIDMNISEEFNDDLNITVSKPMMVVPPAVNPVTPRNKSLTPNRSNRRSFTFTSPAMAVIDRLLSLSGNNSMVHETTVTQVSREQNEADIALSQLRELLAEKEINVYALKSESNELRDRLSTLECHVKNLEAESEDRLKKINKLTDTLTEKTKINKSMAAVVEEYERTIASLIAETAQDKKRHAEERIKLINERDEQTAHLASMEVSFSDLHSKYEKSKQVILNCKANEEVYKKSIKEFEENLIKMQNNYELLKQHATSKLNHANQELEKMNRSHEAEVLKLSAMIKRKELHITSLEESLAQKTKANEELTAICDELINKVG